MTEYQYYEFQAIDRPLTREQMAEIRAVSTRAEITPNRFTNTYNYGDFRGDPVEFVEKFFDAHVYVANWGTNILMFGMPETAVNVEALQAYQTDSGFAVQVRGGRVIVTFERQDEDGGGDWIEEDEGAGWMSALVGLRADLINGDLRAAYLGWLRTVQVEGELLEEAEPADDEAPDAGMLEPPVPPGLGSLSGPLEALVRFLDLDQDLVAVATEASQPLTGTDLAEADVTSWIATLSSAEKDTILLRLMQGDPQLRSELNRRARKDLAPAAYEIAPPGRTIDALWQAAEARTAERKQREAEAARQERVRRMAEANRAREAHLASLAGREGELWHQVETGVRTKKPKEYDRAVEILRDLRDVALREGEASDFNTRLSALRSDHSSKPSFIQRLDKARLT
jgi:hypothetical protein